MLPNERESLDPDILKWLGEHRDGFLVAGAILYGLGYLVWSYNSWKNGLGQLPALEFQYLIAGIVPALIIAVAWTGIAFFQRVRKKLFDIFKAHRSLYWIITLVLVLPGLYLSLAKWLPGKLATKEITTYGTPIFLVISYLQIVTAKANDEEELDLPTRLFRYVFAIMFLYYGLLIFFELYPRLPQELGGPEPRCAYVDLDPKQISGATRRVLINNAPAAQSQTEVVRSRELQVFFSSNDFLLVRTADRSSNDKIPTGKLPLYELRKEVIRVVTWCR